MNRGVSNYTQGNLKMSKNIQFVWSYFIKNFIRELGQNSGTDFCNLIFFVDSQEELVE